MPVQRIECLAVLGALALACSTNEDATGGPADSGDDTRGSESSTDDGGSASAPATTGSTTTTGATTDDSSSDDDGSSGDTTSDATVDTSTTGEPAVCGDGIQSGDEPCDDGNTDINDGCTPECESQRVVQISAGGWNTCAILDTGALRCWGEAPAHGYPGAQNIGDDETPASVGDVDVGGTPARIVNGYRHGCVLLDTGAVRCWGESPSGQLGYGNVAPVLSPEEGGDVDVGGVVTQLASGMNHTCVLFDDATVRCWGFGGHGQLGQGSLGSIGDDETPASVDVVDAGGDVVQLAVGLVHTCALIEGGDVRCWGNGTDGALGYGNIDAIGDDEAPSHAGSVLVGGVVIQISAGGNATCALLERGTVRCWGRMEASALGYPGMGVVGDDEVPAEVGDVDIGGSVAHVSVGPFQICALLDAGSLRCWGYGVWGNLGYGSMDPIGDTETPASAGDVPLGGEVEQITAKGFGHSCAVLRTGAVRCWGVNVAGQLGYPSLYPQPIGDTETPDSVGNVEVF